jgi:S1-C subfamily serine protease
VVVDPVLIVTILVSVFDGRRHDVGADANIFDIQQVADLAEAATVHLSRGQRLGAGFFVTSDLVVTNAHVLCQGSPGVLVTLADGRTVDGRVVIENGPSWNQ